MLDTRSKNFTVARSLTPTKESQMKSSFAITIAAIAAFAPAGAQGLFMSRDWSSDQARSLPAAHDPHVRAEDNDGIRAHKLARVSPQYYAPRYKGRASKDGICDELQPRAHDNIAIIGYKNAAATHTLYTSGRGDCRSVYYPGYNAFGGGRSQNMALAPSWDGTPDWKPSTFGYMDWTDPRYNPAMRYGG